MAVPQFFKVAIGVQELPSTKPIVLKALSHLGSNFRCHSGFEMNLVNKLEFTLELVLVMDGNTLRLC